jgi:hypothetical protein
MELTLIKTKTFKLEPFGKFFISMARHPKKAPHIIDFRELEIDCDTKMPFTKEQEKEIIKIMKKNKTDIFTDNNYSNYTRVSGGEYGSLGRVKHPNLTFYRENDSFRELIDSTYK